MATNWPTSRDTFTNPSSGDTLDSPSHAAQHANVNDAVEAMQLYAGLVLVKSQTIGSGVSSVTVTDAFSSTFNDYKIVVSGGTCSSDSDLYFQFSPTAASGYYLSMVYGSYAGGSALHAYVNNGTRINYVGGGTTMVANFEVHNPFDSSVTKEVIGRCRYATVYGVVVGHIPILASYTSFIIGPASGTLTGGTIKVYGYNNG